MADSYGIVSDFYTTSNAAEDVRPTGEVLSLRHRSSSITSQFLESRGFGWLMETEEEDEEELPLL